MQIDARSQQRSVAFKWTGLLLICLSIIYGAFLTKTYFWDGVLSALNIEGVRCGELPYTVLFHQNHLLYSALGYVLYDAALGLNLQIRAVTVLQILNVCASLAATWVLFALIKRCTRSQRIGLFGATLFAFGATWWKFSTDTDTYILAVLFLVLAVFFALDSPPRIFPTAVCHVMAMLLHELAVFTYFPLLVSIALECRWSKGKRFWTACAYSGVTGACVTAAYAACYSSQDHAAYPSLFAWITNYPSDSGFTRSFGQLVNANLSSFIKLFVGGKLSLIRDYFSVTVGFALALAIGMCIYAVILLRSRGQFEVTYRDSRALAIFWAWLIPCAIFLASWDPGVTHHKLFIWPAIVLLVASYLASRRSLQQHAPALTALVIAMAAWNFGAFIYPHSHASADPVLTLAQKIDRELPKNAIVYYRALDPDDWYLDYFAPGRNWRKVSGSHDLRRIRESSSSGRRVCLETTALQELERNSTQISILPIDPKLRWELVNNRHNVRLECLKQ